MISRCKLRRLSVTESAPPVCVIYHPRTACPASVRLRYSTAARAHHAPAHYFLQFPTTLPHPPSSIPRKPRPASPARGSVSPVNAPHSFARPSHTQHLHGSARNPSGNFTHTNSGGLALL
ncbi:hypothetical protein HYPSUDRAFT_32556 [Hypholoma sublateritium FD-334 SS-4]|uniref:Uncharacterized protein n=1 Tax=Hypholoma sublateritium (strain FD-334 SS-4) TaxID=945553 RepID=A0A0D2QC56_HYPSF|nr:hypothetical protein HYPSUDRAFT_32556 [Hypholoma sublateritium FD-334 SS-4]